jgi:hypothetical protein
MALDKVYAGDVGTKIRLDSGSNISAATTLKIKYKKPDGSTGEWTAVLEGTTQAYYITQVNDLDQRGKWELQLFVVLPTWTGHGETCELQIYRRLSDA